RAPRARGRGQLLGACRRGSQPGDAGRVASDRMKRLHDLIGVIQRMGGLFGRHKRDRDLRDEIEFHLAMRQQEFERQGASPEAARLAARRQFGNVTLYKERTNDMWTFPSFESVVQ